MAGEGLEMKEQSAGLKKWDDERPNAKGREYKQLYNEGLVGWEADHEE